MTSANQTLALSKCRAQVLTAAASVEIPVSSGVEYVSNGRVVVIGGEAGIFRLFRSRLPKETFCQHLEMDQNPGLELSGYLGKFCITLCRSDGEIRQIETDIVVDLAAEPLLKQAVLPPGYLRQDDLDIDSLAEQTAALRGTFSKPKYFYYDRALCVHGRAGKQACCRCITSCPAEAITSLAEQIVIDPWRCQGGGICTSVCPSGAITYAGTPAAVVLNRMRLMLRTHRQLDDAPAVLVLGSTEDLQDLDFPAAYYPVLFEEVGAAGPQLLLSALAYGAAAVVLFVGTRVPNRVKLLLHNQLIMLQEVLVGLGFPAGVLQLQEGQALQPVIDASMPGIQPAGFAGLEDKRRSFFLALDHLFAKASSPSTVTNLLPGAAFGAVEVDPARCTLCMGCTSVCPPHALEAGGDEPLLRFHESKCVQCGLCQQLCPESAITLIPRIINDSVERSIVRILYQEVAFCCVVCNKAFAVRSLIEQMTARLHNHPMFQSERARRRLQMCEDCRVVDIAQDQSALTLEE